MNARTATSNTKTNGAARSIKAEIKARKPAAPTTKPEVTEPTEPAMENAAFARAVSALSDLMGEYELPTWQRSLTALVVGIACAAGAGWLLGMVFGPLIAMSSNSIVAFFIWVLGIACSAIAGMFAGNAAAAMVLNRTIENAAVSAKNKVVGWFTTKPAVTGFFKTERAA